MNIRSSTAPSEYELRSNWSGTIPVVSVLVPVFNHRPWIEDCLNGILSQVTSFPFEVIVRDDASTDGTQEILRRWRERYPSIIKLELNDRNLFFTQKALPSLLPRVGTEYIALCEGDDYWCQSDKLQRQFELLSELENVVCVGHGMYVKVEGSEHCYGEQTKTIRHTQGDMRVIKSIPTLSMMFRKSDSFPTTAMQRAPFGDVVLKSFLASRGDVLYEGQYLGAVYRVHDKGLFNGLSQSEALIKSAISQLEAAHDLAIRGESKAATELLTIANRDTVRYFDRYFKTQAARSINRATSWTARLHWWLRMALRESRAIRYLYFKGRRRPDPISTTNTR